MIVLRVQDLPTPLTPTSTQRSGVFQAFISSKASERRGIEVAELVTADIEKRYTLRVKVEIF